MQWSEVLKPPSPRVLRQFAALWVAFFLGLATFRWFGGTQDGWAVALAAVALVGLPGLAVPSLMRPIFTGWMVVVFPIGWTVSRVLLGIVFFLLVTPLAAAFKLMGRDLLRRRRPTASTYWRDKVQPGGPSSYLRQF